jgi:hypothetical protein
VPHAAPGGLLGAEITRHRLMFHSSCGRPAIVWNLWTG